MSATFIECVQLMLLCHPKVRCSLFLTKKLNKQQTNTMQAGGYGQTIQGGKRERERVNTFGRHQRDSVGSARVEHEIQAN